MASRLQHEIQQSKPFQTLELEAMLNLARTSDEVRRLLQQILKPYGVSETQFNVLRILRGAGTDGLTCAQISERMITHAPDITRLLDRLQQRALVVREREEQDRRVVLSRITAAGLELLKLASNALDDTPVTLLQSLSKDRIEVLIELLEEIRCAAQRERRRHAACAESSVAS